MAGLKQNTALAMCAMRRLAHRLLVHQNGCWLLFCLSEVNARTARKYTVKTLLYVSELADEASPSVVGAIAKAARANNAQLGISGMLIFDGGRFAQLLEGPAEAVDHLLEKLEADRRHVHLRVLSMREHDARAHFASWGLGYLWIDEDENDGIERLLRQTSAMAAEAAFLDLASSADRDGAASTATPG